MTIDSSIVVVASASVGPMRSPINSATFFLKKNDSPKSPVNMCPIHTKNCEMIGLSSPSLARISTISCVVADAPAMIAAGSPGVSRNSANTNTATTAITGIVANRRRAM